MWRRNEPALLQVQIVLDAHNGGTRVIVTHSGIGAEDDWEKTIKRFERGWENALENVQSIMEAG